METKVRGRFAVWGLDTTQQPNALELDTANSAGEVTDIKKEWRSVYPEMKFQLVMPGKEVEEKKWL